MAIQGRPFLEVKRAILVPVFQKADFKSGLSQLVAQQAVIIENFMVVRSGTGAAGAYVLDVFKIRVKPVRHRNSQTPISLQKLKTIRVCFFNIEVAEMLPYMFRKEYGTTVWFPVLRETVAIYYIQ